MSNKSFTVTKRKGIYNLTPGRGTWLWLSGVAAKQSMWLLGSLTGRGGYEAWMTHLVDGLQGDKLALEMEKTSDPWQRSRLVGEKISQLAKEFSKLTKEQKDELAQRAEIELKAGTELMKKDKENILELLKTVMAPLDP